LTKRQVYCKLLSIDDIIAFHSVNEIAQGKITFKP
jgi:hypothetical protein